MVFEEIVAPTIKQQLVSRLEGMILSGQLRVGDKLPTERELAAMMKISRSAVHQGVAEMARIGFLEIIPRRGIFVADYAENGNLEVLSAMVNFGGGMLDNANTYALVETRMLLETPALRKVTRERDPKLIDRLERLLDEAKRLQQGGRANCAAIADVYFRFHHAIFVFGGNSITPLIFNAFRAPSVGLWTRSAVGLGLPESVGRLETFFSLIVSGDEEGAIKHLQYVTSESGIAQLAHDAPDGARVGR